MKLYYDDGVSRRNDVRGSGLGLVPMTPRVSAAERLGQSLWDVAGEGVRRHGCRTEIGSRPIGSLRRLRFSMAEAI